MPAFAQIYAIVRERLVLSPAVGGNAPHEVVHSACSDGRGEGLDLADDVRVLPHLLFAVGAQEEEGTVLVKVMLEGEFCGSFYMEILSYHALVEILLRRLRT